MSHYKGQTNFIKEFEFLLKFFLPQLKETQFSFFWVPILQNQKAEADRTSEINGNFFWRKVKFTDRKVHEKLTNTSMNIGSYRPERNEEEIDSVR